MNIVLLLYVEVSFTSVFLIHLDAFIIWCHRMYIDTDIVHKLRMQCQCLRNPSPPPQELVYIVRNWQILV